VHDALLSRDSADKEYVGHFGVDVELAQDGRVRGRPVFAQVDPVVNDANPVHRDAV
jgi:hypothetical protein